MTWIKDVASAARRDPDSPVALICPTSPRGRGSVRLANLQSVRRTVPRISLSDPATACPSGSGSRWRRIRAGRVFRGGWRNFGCLVRWKAERERGVRGGRSVLAVVSELFPAARRRLVGRGPGVSSFDRTRTFARGDPESVLRPPGPRSNEKLRAAGPLVRTVRSWPVAVRQFRENKYFNTQIPPAVKAPIADRRNLSACVNFRRECTAPTDHELPIVAFDNSGSYN